MAGILNRFSLFAAYKRWRHGRGFGVHSPFAYSLIENTLRQTLPYYRYHDIELIAGSRAFASRLKLLFRLLSRFQPTKVAVCGSVAADQIRQTIQFADSRIAYTDACEADMVVCCCDYENKDEQRTPATVFVFLGDSCKSAYCRYVQQTTQRGMVFDNCRDTLLVIRSPKLPRQKIDLKF